MTQISNQQRQLIFDYCIGLTSESENVEAKVLISSNKEAAEIHTKLKNALSPLESLEYESCPDYLVERTILRLNNAASSSQLGLEQLLAAEEATTVPVIKGRFWRNLGEMLATAAAILLIAGVSIPTLQQARQNYWKQSCQRQLSSIFQGINTYSNDHEGKLPAVATASGEPWWKVGYEGPENYSNTRNMWLLARKGYVRPVDFVCPGKRQGLVIQLDPKQAGQYNDFPAKKYVTYSFRIRCNKSQRKKYGPCGKILMSDMNPLFERLPQDYSKQLKLKLDKSLLNVNSSNHSRRGQNVLFGNGSVRFVKMRQIGIRRDDIFTLQDTRVYKGVERPGCETDAFLAP